MELIPVNQSYIYTHYLGVSISGQRDNPAWFIGFAAPRDKEMQFWGRFARFKKKLTSPSFHRPRDNTINREKVTLVLFRMHTRILIYRNICDHICIHFEVKLNIHSENSERSHKKQVSKWPDKEMNVTWGCQLTSFRRTELPNYSHGNQALIKLGN